MNSDREPLQLADAVERVAASVVGLATRRQRSAGAGVARRRGGGQRVGACGAPAAWPSRCPMANRSTARCAASTPAPISPWCRSPTAACRRSCAMPTSRLRVGDVVFAVGREPSGQLQASFGHIGAVGRTVAHLARRPRRAADPARRRPVPGPCRRRRWRTRRAACSVSPAPVFSRHHGVVLPVATIERVVEQLLTHGRVQQGYLGIAAQPVRAAARRCRRRRPARQLGGRRRRPPRAPGCWWAT